MFRLLLIVCLIHAPLFAVSAGDGSPLELTDLRITIDLSTDKAAVTCKATLRNPGDETHAARLTLPRDVVPEDQREAFTLKVAGVSKPSTSGDSFRWDVAFEPAQQLEVSWAYTLHPVDLPHAHPQGLREVRVALGHMNGYAALPENCAVTVTSPGMPPELFGRDEGDTTTSSLPTDRHLDDYRFAWLAITWEEKRDALLGVLKEFDEPQRTHLNRSYSETLVHLADLYALKDEHEALAATAATLATLETQAGRAITHCGPWAEWRRHVPWQLRRMQALKAQGKDATEAAKSAVERMGVLWPVYLKAREKPQPFEYFDRRLYGNYWDYDWDRTRDLYADALELLGETEPAKAVRDTE